jgi:predicted Fe-Mo cluster-binding NifX family protein
MATTNKEKLPLRIAMPYYGSRVMPRFGLARHFYFVTVDPQTSQVADLQQHMWDPQDKPSVARWLREHQVNGVICDGIHPRFQTALEVEGLWVLWGAWGEVNSVLDQWLAGELPLPNGDTVRGRQCSYQQVHKRCNKVKNNKSNTLREPSMKIAITAQNPSPESQVDSRFGRAAWIMIYDQENKSWESIDNSTGINASHGAGIQAAQKVVDHQAVALVTGAIGPKAFKSLTAAAVKIFHGANGTVENALSAYLEGKLSETCTNDATGGV